MPVPTGFTLDQPQQAPPPSTGPKGLPAGFTLDQPAQPQAQQPQLEFRAMPEPQNVSDRLTRWSENVMNDIKYGTDITGVGTVLKKMGAHGVYNGNSQGVGDFMASLPLGLLRAFKGQNEIESGHVWQGTKDIAGGGLQAATIPGAFVAPEAGELEPGVQKGLAAAGDIASTAAGAIRKGATTVRDLPGAAWDKAAEAVSTARRIYKGSDLAQADSTLQQNLAQVDSTLQQNLRRIADNIATEKGLPDRPPVSSIRDVFDDLGANMRAQAKGIYQKLDEAGGGGRFQRFDQQIANLRSKIKQVTGVDPDLEGELTERLNHVEQARQDAFDEIRKAGVDPDLIQEANAHYKQTSALNRVTRMVRASAKGMRPEVAQGPGHTPETLTAQSLFEDANHAYDSKVLQQALGEDHAKDMLNQIDAAKLSADKMNAIHKARTAEILEKQKAAKIIAKYGLGAIGAGSAAAAGRAGWELLK